MCFDSACDLTGLELIQVSPSICGSGYPQFPTASLCLLPLFIELALIRHYKQQTYSKEAALLEGMTQQTLPGNRKHVH